jgi:hypothetical protein
MTNIKLMEKAQLYSHVFYWNCRLNGRTALLAGPFATAEIAQEAGECVSPICVNYRPETHKATFGVMRCKAPGQGGGVYNDQLPERLIGELLIDTGYREGPTTH